MTNDSDIEPIDESDPVTMETSTDIHVSSITHFIPQQSKPESNQFVFSYTITIENNGSTACQLMSRHWIIKDANGKVEEVFGEGVVGEQPIIKPGHSYTYTSGAVLETEIGTMEGRYLMIRNSASDAQNADEFVAPIPKFVLSIPRTLH